MQRAHAHGGRKGQSGRERDTMADPNLSIEPNTCLSTQYSILVISPPTERKLTEAGKSHLFGNRT